MGKKVLWITGDGRKTEKLSGRVYNSNVYHFDDRETHSRVLVQYNFHMRYYEFQVWEHTRLWGVGIGFATVLEAYKAGAANYESLRAARRGGPRYEAHILGSIINRRPMNITR